jgi:hypothetical protein
LNNKKGTIHVAATGNKGKCDDIYLFPAYHKDVISVVSTGVQTHSISSFSSLGPGIFLLKKGKLGYMKPELGAPGSSITSWDRTSGVTELSGIVQFY